MEVKEVLTRSQEELLAAISELDRRWGNGNAVRAQFYSRIVMMPSGHDLSLWDAYSRLFAMIEAYVLHALGRISSEMLGQMVRDHPRMAAGIASEFVTILRDKLEQ